MKPEIRYDPELAKILLRTAYHYRRHEDGNVTGLLKEAVTRAPHRLDIRFCLANFHVQTGKPELALNILLENSRAVPNPIENNIHLAHWLRYFGDSDRAEDIRRRIGELRPPMAADLGKIWGHIDAWSGSTVQDTLASLPPENLHLAIVIFGYVLNSDGTMRDELQRRLGKGLEAAYAFPEAPIIVSGGVPRSGCVEATVMHRWLVDRGIHPDRILDEGYSRDLVENILYSRQILDILGADQALVVTSANNVRRAGAGLEIAGWTNGSSWQVTVLASTLDGFQDDGADHLKLYRDSLRVYGIPMMQAFPELVER